MDDYTLTITDLSIQEDGQAVHVRFSGIFPEGTHLWVTRVQEHEASRIEVETYAHKQECDAILYQHGPDNADYIHLTIQRPEDGEHDIFLSGSLQLTGNALTTIARWFTWEVPHLPILERDRYGKTVYRLPN